jgi:hypothetical protein
VGVFGLVGTGVSGGVFVCSTFGYVVLDVQPMEVCEGAGRGDAGGDVVGVLEEAGEEVEGDEVALFAASVVAAGPPEEGLEDGGVGGEEGGEAGELA